MFKSASAYLISNIFQQLIGLIILLYGLSLLSPIEYKNYAILISVGAVLNILAEGGVKNFMIHVGPHQLSLRNIFLLQSKYVGIALIIANLIGISLNWSRLELIYINSVLLLNFVNQGYVRHQYVENTQPFILRDLVVLIIVIVGIIVINDLLVIYLLPAMRLIVGLLVLLRYNRHIYSEKLNIEFKFFNQAIYLLPILIVTIYNQVDVFFLDNMENETIAGIFAASSKMSRPLILIVSSIMMVLHVRYAQKLNINEFIRSVRTFYGVIMLFSAIYLPTLHFFAAPILNYVGKSAYLGMGDYLWDYYFVLIPVFVLTPMSTYLVSQGRNMTMVYIYTAASLLKMILLSSFVFDYISYLSALIFSEWLVVLGAVIFLYVQRYRLFNSQL